jgi:hypothetical protein
MKNLYCEMKHMYSKARFKGERDQRSHKRDYNLGHRKMDEDFPTVWKKWVPHEFKDDTYRA